MKINLLKTKVMVSGSVPEVAKSKIDPCGMCGKRVMTNSVLCTVCGKWIHGRCAKVKRVTTSLATSFVCGKCKNNIERIVDRDEDEVLCNGVETVSGFCYLGDRINAGGGCEMAVTMRVRVGWAKFRECAEFLYGKRFSLKLKGKIYQSCVRPAILYGSETWCLKENELGILRRTERAMMRVMCGVKLIERKNTREMIKKLGLSGAIEAVAKANGMRWYGHVLRRAEDNALRKALEFKVEGKRKLGRPKKTWKGQVEKDAKKAGLKKEDALDRAKWRIGIKNL